MGVCGGRGDRRQIPCTEGSENSGCGMMQEVPPAKGSRRAAWGQFHKGTRSSLQCHHSPTWPSPASGVYNRLRGNTCTRLRRKPRLKREAQAQLCHPVVYDRQQTRITGGGSRWTQRMGLGNHGSNWLPCPSWRGSSMFVSKVNHLFLWIF